MNIMIKRSVAEGTVTAPPSKSMAHRALICGALSERSVINNIAYSKDIEATLSCLERAGAYVERNGDSVVIGGLDPLNIPNNSVLDCNESGSTLRFMIPLCLLGDKSIILEGRGRLMDRPQSVYEDICEKQGIMFERGGSSILIKGRLQAGRYEVRGDISSQFITGLLFALPLLDGDSVVAVTGRFESASYIDLTLSVMTRFGIAVNRIGNEFYIKGGQKYVSCDYTVEGDCSNAAFLDGFNLLGGSVSVEGIPEDTLQGDNVYKKLYPMLKNKGNSIDISDCPDLGPVLFALSAYCGGGEFTGTARLRIKESDRAQAMAEELSKFGIYVEVFDNSVIIHKSKLARPSIPLKSHNDHRIVMALSLLCSVTGGVIEGAEAVGKSYPDYFEVIKTIGIKLDIQG